MSASDLTAAELERRTANVRPYAGARRGVAEAIDEAHRQFGFRDHGDARYWLDEAEAAAAVISPQEMNARIESRAAPVRPLQWGAGPGHRGAGPGELHASDDAEAVETEREPAAWDRYAHEFPALDEVDEALFRRFDLEQRLGYESIAEHSLTNDPYKSAGPRGELMSAIDRAPGTSGFPSTVAR
jgi:hypothetical protein